MDSPHTADLSPQTQFHILFAIKGAFFFLRYFGLPFTQQVFDKAEKGSTIAFIGTCGVQHSYTNLSVVLFILTTRG